MTHFDIARTCWERFAARNPAPVQNAYYPTEATLAPLSAYAATGEAKWATMARSQLEYAAGLEQDGLLIVNKTCIHRDPQARLIRDYIVAYHILHDPAYYARAVYCAEKMVAALPRADHTVRGQTFNLFTEEFFDVLTEPRDGIPAPTKFGVDANQNAEVGLAFALLAADPLPFPAGSTLTKSQCQAIAMQETLASMAIQTDTGAIPLREDDTRPDTMYGSYAAFSWVWTCLLNVASPAEKVQLAAHIFAAEEWLGGMVGLKTGSDAYYPVRVENAPISPEEYIWRLPLYWFCHTEDTQSFVEQIFSYLSSRHVDDMNAFNAGFAYYSVMGLAA